MLLTRSTVTVASRVMLPAYVVLNLAFGLGYVFDPGDRVSRIASLAFQRRVLPMPVWGLLLLALAALMLLAFRQESRMAFCFALACCAVTWALWGAMYGASIFLDPRASVLGPVLPWFVTTACVASMASLLKGET